MTVAGPAPGTATGAAPGTAPTSAAARDGQATSCRCRCRRPPQPRRPSRVLSALLSAGALFAAAAWLSVPERAAADPGPAPGPDHDGYSPECGGLLTAPRGVIHSPNFPGRFAVPLRCRWVIDASTYTKPTIYVYLTQVYVLNGLNFYAYAHYGRTRMGESKVHSVDPSNVTTSHWLSSKYPYLVVDLALDQLEGNHLRVLSHLQDVFGFNLTYEVREEDAADPFVPCNDSFCCNTMLCGFVGDCYVDADFQKFYCACPPGYEGLDCGSGPMCREEPGICRNGGTCKSYGTEFIVCHCAGNYTGTFCEIPPVDEEDRECYSGDGAVCNCTGGPRVVTDRSRYSVEVRLAGPTDPGSDPHFRENLNRTFTRHMMEYLENANVSVASDLHVTSIEPANDTDRGLDLLFEVVSGPTLRPALGRLVRDCPGCLGAMRLARDPKIPEPEPMLHLLELQANLRSGLVREGDEFILSCVARGATSMQFSWYKDGVLINASLARRKLISQVQAHGNASQWNAVLVVEVSSPLDAGRFTCRVVDRGSEQCRSVDVRVLSPPRLSVRPLVHTVRAGANVTTCCYTGAERIGVTWTRNKALLGLNPGKEVEEDLEFPPGSLLRLYNVQQSVTYTCKVGKTEVESRVDVVGRALVPECAAGRASAVDWATTPAGREARIECSALVGYIGGLARRQCVLRDHGRGEDDEDGDGSGGHGAQWEEPDFSECVQEEIAAIRDNFIGLTLGYANTTALQTLEAVRRWLESRGGEEDDEEDAAHAEASTAARAAGLRPREGEPILALAVDVAAYQRKVLGARSLLQLREELFRIVDLLLLQSGPPGRGQRRQRSHAVQDNVAIGEVQALVREQALLWASSLPSPLSSASSSVSSSASSSASSGRMAGPLAGPLPPPSPTGPAYSQMEVHVVGANDLDEAGRAQGVPLPEWVGPAGSRLRLHVSKALAQRSVVAAVVAFKSLHKLLPERSVAELPDSSELEYELASSLVSVSLGSEAGELIKDVSGGKDFAADVVLLVTVPGDPEESAFPGGYGPQGGSAGSPGYLWPRWGVACAVTDIARGVTTPGPLPWNTSACATLPVDWDPHDLRPGSFNLRCNCTLPGTIAVLLTSNTSESAVPLGPRPPVALVSGLALCALQAGLAALFLLPRWLGRPSCMLFLKLQSSAASSASAGLFLAGLSHSATNGSSPGLVAALHCCLLTALAAHLGKLLLLYTELVGVRPLPHLRQSLLAMVAGAPLVGVLCGLVAARSMLSPAHLRGMAWAWGWPAWAPWGTRVCSVFVATAAFILVAFGALLCAVAARLAGGAARRRGGKDKQAAAAERDSSAPHRRGLVRRSCAILLCQVAVVVLSVLYVSVKSAVVCYVFSATSVVLGAVTLFCYVLRPEGPRDAAARGAALGEQKRGGAAGAGRTPADITSDPTQTEPLTSACSRVPGLGWLRWLHPRPLWRPLRAAAAAVRSNARSYQLVPPRPAGPDTPTPARLGESLCPFIVFTKQDAELESEAAATMPAAVGKEAMEAVDMQRAVAAAEMGRLAAGPGSPTTAAPAAVCTCQVGCLSSVHGHPQRYVSMCPVPCAMAVHVPVMAAALPCPDHLAGGGPGAGAGSVLGVGRDASLLDKDAMALPLQDLEAMAPPERSPSKYLYMRCRPCRAEDGGEYVQHEAMAAAGAAALPPGHPGRGLDLDGASAPAVGAAKFPRTLYHNDRAGLERLEQPCLPRHPAAHEPLRPEPVPCYIRGEPGVPLVVSPSRAAPPPPHGPRPRVQVQVVQADVEPTPRARAPTAPAPPPRTHHSSPPSSEDPLDEDVLNRISHDLDYLLSGDPPPASASGPVANGTSATPSAIVGSTTATSAAAVIKAGAVLPPP